MYLPPCCFVGFVVEIIMQENPRWGEKSPTFTLTRPFLLFLVEQENAPLHFAFPSLFEHPWICYCRLSLIVSLSSVLVFFSGKSRVSDFTNSCGISMIFFFAKNASFKISWASIASWISVVKKIHANKNIRNNFSLIFIWLSNQKPKKTQFLIG